MREANATGCSDPSGRVCAMTAPTPYAKAIELAKLGRSAQALWKILRLAWQSQTLSRTTASGVSLRSKLFNGARIVAEF